MRDNEGHSPSPLGRPQAEANGRPTDHNVATPGADNFSLPAILDYFSAGDAAQVPMDDGSYHPWPEVVSSGAGVDGTSALPIASQFHVQDPHHDAMPDLGVANGQAFMINNTIDNHSIPYFDQHHELGFHNQRHPNGTSTDQMAALQTFHHQHQTDNNRPHAHSFSDFIPNWLQAGLLPPVSGLPFLPHQQAPVMSSPAPTLASTHASQMLPHSHRISSRTVDSIRCTEEGCKRNFRPKTEGSRFCRRHQMKWDRNHAAPATFTFQASINSYQAAKNNVYPLQMPLNVEGEQISRALCEQHADRFVSEFVKAASTPYEAGSDYHEFHSRQQKVFNGKSYKNEEVNIRMRFLYEACIVLHAGGETVYPEGGDNGGYGRPDKTLKFRERINKIIGILRRDKRVCMDVVEGRGVTAFVANPDKYEKRKTQNKDSNERKQKKHALGTKVQMKRKAKGQAVEESDVGSDEEELNDGEYDEDDEEGQEDGKGDMQSLEGRSGTATSFVTPASMTMEIGPSFNDAGPSSGGPASRTRKQAARMTKRTSSTAPRSKKLRSLSHQAANALEEALVSPPEEPLQQQQQIVAPAPMSPAGPHTASFRFDSHDCGHVAHLPGAEEGDMWDHRELNFDYMNGDFGLYDGDLQ